MKSFIHHARVTLAVMAISVGARGALAQTAVPCKGVPCGFAIDWGTGKTSANFPQDRRYGSGDDFESKFKSAMAARGYVLRDGTIPNGFSMSLRLTSKSGVMCDAMPGTNTDMSCTALTDVAVAFSTYDAAVKAPSAMRISNRCGAGNIFMSNATFAQYAADMIWFQWEGQAAKADRPVSRC